jgi:hypothetical protein
MGGVVCLEDAPILSLLLREASRLSGLPRAARHAKRLALTAVECAENHRTGHHWKVDAPIVGPNGPAWDWTTSARIVDHVE